MNIFMYVFMCIHMTYIHICMFICFYTCLFYFLFLNIYHFGYIFIYVTTYVYVCVCIYVYIFQKEYSFRKSSYGTIVKILVTALSLMDRDKENHLLSASEIKSLFTCNMGSQ